MRFPKYLAVLVTAILAFGLSACTVNSEPEGDRATARVFLYGETHGREATTEKELEIWKEHYQNDGMRHLFIEVSYNSGQLLNAWMQSDNDDLLNVVYDNTEGTQGHVPAVKEFYRSIKQDCPETIFHGTDIEHQFDTTGPYYLDYLEQHDLKKSEEYALAQEAIEQGMRYYEDRNDVYRENTMVENFVRELDKLDNQKIMGIYGSAHTGLNSWDYTISVLCMATQLKDRYGDIFYSETLS